MTTGLLDLSAGMCARSHNPHCHFIIITQPDGWHLFYLQQLMTHLFVTVVFFAWRAYDDDVEFSPVSWLGPKTGNSLALFYINQVSLVNSNGFTMNSIGIKSVTVERNTNHCILQGHSRQSAWPPRCTHPPVYRWVRRPCRMWMSSVVQTYH